MEASEREHMGRVRKDKARRKEGKRKEKYFVLHLCFQNLRIRIDYANTVALRERDESQLGSW